jgi:calcineurin-like phosphoesterase family protein
MTPPITHEHMAAARAVGLGLILTAAFLALAAAVGMTFKVTAAPRVTKTLMAAGDIACPPGAAAKPSRCQHRATGDLLAGADAVAPLGDLQYPDGRLEDFNQAYHPTWGQYAAKTYPAPGNHDYHMPGAKGYFDYWASKGRPTGGAGKGFHSFDLDSWHVVALNSNCSEVSCAEGSQQNTWLETDLAATTERCIVAYWHHPRFNSGTRHGEATKTGPLWDDLYAARADIILNGHEHNYQRYAKQSPAGQAVSNGIREFIVGTGGMSLSALGAEDANFEVGNDRDFGVLKLTLASDSYSWQYVGVGGRVLDSGGPVACN